MTSTKPRRPLIGWARLMTPEQRRRYLGDLGLRILHPARVPRCCENLPRYCRRHAYLGLKTKPANFHGFRGSIPHMSEARGIPPNTIAAAITSGELRALKVRGQWWVLFSDFDRWQDKHGYGWRWVQ